MWDFCAWVGIIALAVLAVKIAYFAVESLAVARIGWTRWYRVTRRERRDNGGAPAGFG